MTKDTPEEDQRVLHHRNGSELGIKLAGIKPQTTTAGTKPLRHLPRITATGTTVEPTLTCAGISQWETPGKGHPMDIKSGQRTVTMRGKFSPRERGFNKTGTICTTCENN